MEIYSQLTKADYSSFTRYSLRKESRKRLIIFGCIAVLMCFFNYNSQSDLTINLINIAMTLSVFGLFFLAINWLIGRNVNKVLKNNPFLLNKRKISITEEGLEDKSDSNRGFFKWEAILSVEVVNGLILIYIGKNMAIIVPQRDFKSEKESGAFVAFIKDKINRG